jgi:hypothetical protein
VSQAVGSLTVGDHAAETRKTREISTFFGESCGFTGFFALQFRERGF